MELLQNSPRGIRLKYFTDDNNLEIAFPNSPTRYGYNSSNTLDFAIISNFNYPYNIIILEQLPPVGLLSEKSQNEIKLFDYAKINSESTLEEKVAKFADAVSSAHNLASKPIKNTRHSYTPQHINYLITCKNRARKLYQQTLNPLHKTEANRLQKLIKKEIRIHAQNTWNAKLESLETQDNSLWRMQKYFRKKRSDIPNLTGPNGIASNDEQKANLIANTFIDNYTENKRPGKHTTNIDSDVTNTLTRFFSTPPSSPISPTDPDEICDYLKKLKNSKAPGIDNITNKMIKKFPFKIILIFTYIINKILLLRHFPTELKVAIVFPIHKPGKNKNSPDAYRPISLLSSLSKIAEHIILNRIKNHIYSTNFLNLTSLDSLNNFLLTTRYSD
ncbi:probable RNA-directed DNA polymerase from transposon X-element [Trichonephila clavipes]|nr:probable RNA-directed DNA polymerase from transposon X-element [Trichonephila clavipes]